MATTETHAEPSGSGGSDIAWIDLPLGYAYHPLNAYDADDADDGSVVVDLCTYEAMFDSDVLGPIGDCGLGRLERWVFDPDRRTASITVIDDRANEFPRCNDAVSTKAHRYG